METKVKGFTLGLSLTALIFAVNGSVNAANIVDLNGQDPKDIILDSPVLGDGLANHNNGVFPLHYKQQQYQLRLLKQQVDKSGQSHSRYVQIYNDIPVWGRQLIKHSKPRKGNKSALLSSGVNNQEKYTGKLVNGIDLDLAGFSLVPTFSKEEALNLGKKLYLDNNQRQDIIPDNLIYENEKTDLVIYTHDKDGKAKLAYNVSFFVDDQDGNIPARPNFLIDVSTKEVIKHWDSLMHKRAGTGPGGNEKIGKYIYGGDMPKLDVRVAARGECFMTNDKVRTVNLKNGYYGAKTQHFSCYNSDNDAVNGAYSPLNDAHYYGEQLFNMYNDWYDKAPLTFKLIMRVHYGKGYENAFWNGSSMTFGDGRDYFYPLVSMDVVGHEVSHGYTEQNSNLEYMGQSGGINESFSDMAGKASEYYVFGKNSWGIGDDITKGDEPLRYLDEPEKDGISIGDARDYQDWLDVHYSSGVFNKAFYLLATYDNWTIKKAFDVFVHANTYYWVPTTDYVDGATGAVYSAEDLGYDTKDVIEVLKQVGLGCDGKSCELLPDNRTGSPKGKDGDVDIDGDEKNSNEEESQEDGSDSYKPSIK